MPSPTRENRNRLPSGRNDGHRPEVTGAGSPPPAATRSMLFESFVISTTSSRPQAPPSDRASVAQMV